MQKSDLERFQDGLASGSGPESATITQDGTDYDYNLIGAVNEMLTVFEDMEKYGLAWSDLTTEQQNAVDRGQQALQEQAGNLGDLLSTIGGNDGDVTLGDGRTIDLPNPASNTTSKDIPSGGN